MAGSARLTASQRERQEDRQDAPGGQGGLEGDLGGVEGYFSCFALSGPYSGPHRQLPSIMVDTMVVEG